MTDYAELYRQQTIVLTRLHMFIATIVCVYVCISNNVS